MKKLLYIFTIAMTIASYGQEKAQAFKSGEWLRYRMSYSGFFKAGTAELSLKETTLDGKKVLHAKGEGKTSDVVGWFFKVDDTYESYFDTETVKPYYFKRKIDEGGYKKHKHIKFNHEKNTAMVQDFIKQEDTVISVNGVQDMISTFYFLRAYDTQSLTKGEQIDVDMFFDNKTYPFKLKFLGNEMVETKFGKVKTQKFRPLVQAGRVFKAEESVTIWITADDNKIPIKMKASLAVGSLRAELEAYKGLANPFEIVFDQN
ncbi:DUF3108 domain-containing protein [Tenacibaculum sp. IB213877]|uniref:DUF3108 domain-containing protein n=1 Tax=Tenacibaculum sp. IB213877 TaxID=3097351 RepID=UPI002A5A5DBB|nr:DUF3108 domain-containing protein [Tenacibaculum sp. IB213877]MDY0781333.1 DUF3108 domain-containing protein [Tenacibaculum sp. IB213877]